MRTVKVVVIGASGVGKTCIRHQYVSEHFTTGYRATIGADFVTKTLHHHADQDEAVTLQIWDTAGQERFSSLSAAFFRGADAAVLMFDVNQPATLQALTRWWSEFRMRAPVPDEDAYDFCCAVVGNKIDVRGGGPAVTEPEAMQFLHELVPPPSTPPSPDTEMAPPPLALPQIVSHAPSVAGGIEPPRTDSIDIAAKRRVSKSRSRSRASLFLGGTFGTMTTSHTIYHTPSSSFFDAFESARASPAPTSAYSSTSSRAPSLSPDRILRRAPSDLSTSSAPTITPSLFIRAQATTASTTPPSPSPGPESPSLAVPPPVERGPKLFFTSAKTGEGVPDVFEYIARRVVARWEYEEALEARTLYMQDGSDDGTIRLGYTPIDRVKESCCGS